MGCTKDKNKCPDPSLPTVDESAIECCELTQTNCVVASEYQSFFKIGKGKTLTYVIDKIASFVQTNRNRISDLESRHLYKEYISFLNQSGTNAPVNVDTINEFNITPTYTRSGSGKYLLAMPGAFPTQSKVVISIKSFDKTWGQDVKAYWVDANTIAIESGENTDYIDDGVISNLHLSVKVYN